MAGRRRAEVNQQVRRFHVCCKRGLLFSFLLMAIPLLVFAQSGVSGSEYSGSFFSVTVPDSWFGYWADDLHAARGGLTEEMIEKLDIVFLAESQVDAETLSSMEAPEGMGFVMIMMGPLPPEDQEMSEEAWAEGFYDGFERNLEGSERGKMEIAGRSGYFLKGILIEKGSDDSDKPMQIFVAATRPGEAAFVFSTTMPDGSEYDINLFATDVLKTVVFY